jgi:hypothetical protein
VPDIAAALRLLQLTRDKPHLPHAADGH